MYDKVRKVVAIDLNEVHIYLSSLKNSRLVSIFALLLFIIKAKLQDFFVGFVLPMLVWS